MLLHCARLCLLAEARLCDALAARTLDLDPVDLGHVRDCELLDHLGRNRAVVFLLRVLDLLRQRGEAVGSEPLDRLGDAVLLVLFDLVGKRSGRTTDDSDRMCLDVIAEWSRSVEVERVALAVHALREKLLPLLPGPLGHDRVVLLGQLGCEVRAILGTEERIYIVSPESQCVARTSRAGGRTREDRVRQRVGRVRLDGVQELQPAALDDAGHALHVNLLAREARKSRLELGIDRLEALGRDG